MLLIKCPICEKDISPNAEFCPNCGEPMKKKKEIYDICNVVLIEVLNKNKNMIKIIKQIKDIANCGLKEARDSVDNPPSIIIKNIDYSKAENYKQLLEDLGAVIELVPLDTNRKFNEFIGLKVGTKQVKQEIVIKCSNCGSINTKKISGVNKVGSVALFGIFSVGKLTKTYQCNKCGYRW